jgi:DNA-binding winged helix-turn-helix (wHTH) protein
MDWVFGDFEFDDHRRRLHWRGQRVKLSGQAVDLLALLVERPAELITREEIQRRLWPDSTVEFEHSLDVVVSRLRTVLGDRGPLPRYVETVPRKGYRFIEPVRPKAEADTSVPPRRPWSRRLATYAAVAVLTALVAIVFVRTHYDKLVPRHPAATSRPAAASSQAP